MEGVLYWGMLVFAGFAVGILNTLASSGSAVSLPLLMLLGIPEVIANATNRIPVLLGAAMATYSFHREKQLDWKAGIKLAPSALIGSILGALTAEKLGNRTMGLFITAAVLVALLLLFTKVKEALSKSLDLQPVVSPLMIAVMGFVGFWLGFIVLDGATYLLLVLILGCHYALPQANALKSLILVTTTFVPVLLFSAAHEIYWPEGIAMSVGSIAGGHFGARFSNHIRAKIWVFRLLIIVMVAELAHLGWHYSAFMRV
jgi:uncharacterized membrane protein YfcA